MSHLLIRADARHIPLAPGSVQCVVTSPPYWGLREYGVKGQLGGETTPEAFAAALVGVMREVRRVLRPDGSLWLNLGDSYSNDSKWGGVSSGKNAHSFAGGYAGQRCKKASGLKCKDLAGIPWRVALALQDDGWYLRQSIIWHKPNAMVEPVVDRPSSCHENVFLFSQREQYAYDWFSCAVPSKTGADTVLPAGWKLLSRLRNVWAISTGNFRGAHFATMPVALAQRCIMLGAPEGGCCPACGAARRRIVGRMRFPTRPGVNTKCTVHSDGDSASAATNGWNRANVIGNRDPRRHVTAYRHEGWKPSCSCGIEATVPSRVFDPFCGAGTTAVATLALGRHAIGTELSREYLAIAARRIERPHVVARKRASTRREEPLPLFRNNDPEPNHA